MRSGARSGSDGSTSVEAGRRVGTSVKSRLAQPPGIVGVFGALRPSVRARWAWRELYANYPSGRHGWDGAKQWPWADRSISNRRKPSDSGRDVPFCVVTCPYPAKNISNLVPWSGKTVTENKNGLTVENRFVCFRTENPPADLNRLSSKRCHYESGGNFGAENVGFLYWGYDPPGKPENPIF